MILILIANLKELYQTMQFILIVLHGVPRLDMQDCT